MSVCLFACLLAGLCKKLCMQFCGLISIGPERPIPSVDFGGASNLDVMMSYLGVFVTYLIALVNYGLELFIDCRNTKCSTDDATLLASNKNNITIFTSCNCCKMQWCRQGYQ